MKGRIRSMEAPVVPIISASTAPNRSRAPLTSGVPRLSMWMRIPPETMKRDATRAMKEIYSFPYH